MEIAFAGGALKMKQTHHGVNKVFIFESTFLVIRVAINSKLSYVLFYLDYYALC